MTARLTLVPAADVAALAPSVRADRLAGYLFDLGVTLAREQWQPEPEPPTSEPWCPDAA